MHHEQGTPWGAAIAPPAVAPLLLVRSSGESQKDDFHPAVRLTV